MHTVTVEEAAALLCGVASPVEAWETVPLCGARGRILARSIYAERPQPPFDRSPLDGYALRAEDSIGASRENPVTLRIIDRVMAGAAACREVTAGTAVRIMTGAPIPKGADCVIRQEDTDYGEERVQLYTPMKHLENFCHSGEDYPAGALLLAAGEKLSAVAVSILASAGITEVPVRRKVRVALITSGDELTAPGTALMPGKIYNTNHFLLRGRLEELGVEPTVCVHVGDELAPTAEAVRAAAGEADLVITTGGVSVGQRDVMHDVVAALGSAHLFYRVAVKPGSPATAYVCDGTPVLALSGNPFGAFVTFELLARPVLAHLSGDDTLRMEKAGATVCGSFPKTTKGRRMVRAIYRRGVVEIPQQGHASGMLYGLKSCNCLVDIQGPNGGLCEGDTVDVWLL